MMRKIKYTAIALGTYAAREREFLSYAAPDLLNQLLQGCPEAAKWCAENASEQTVAVLDSFADAITLESVAAHELGEPCTDIC